MRRPHDYFHQYIALVLTLALAVLPLPLSRAEQLPGAFEEIQLLKGDVYSVKTKDLQRVSITDPAVADISDAKQNEVQVVGQTPGQTVLFVWDTSGKRTIIVRVLAEDLALVKARIKTLLERAKITGVNLEQNDLEGKVMLSGNIPEDKMEAYTAIIDGFQGSVINLVKKEEIVDLVQIDMQITELSTTLSKEMGLNWMMPSSTNTGTYIHGTIAETNNPQTGKIADVFKLGDFNRTSQIMVAVNALLQEGKAKILSKPRLVVKNGKEATFLVGGEIPVRTTTTNASGGTSTNNVEFKQYGVSLAITPTIKEGKVDIVLNVEISDVDGSKNYGSDTAFLTRSAQTQLYLDDHQTIVLAGLIKKSASEKVERVPFLSKIPVIGLLFRNTSTPTPKEDTEVVISLTPTVIKNVKADTAKNVEQVQAAASAPVAAVKQLPVSVLPQPVVTKPVPPPTVRNTEALPVIAKNAASIAVSVPENLKPYAEAVQQRISSSIAYPYEAQENGWQGTVKLSLVIRKDGSLRDVFVKETSGYDVFDQDATNTAQILAPYAPFPATMVQDEITVTIPIVYSLDSFLKNVAKRK